MPAGRPTKYTKKLATDICSRLSEGESLRSIARDDKMPSVSTICRWLLDERYKDFWEQYENARNIQATILFEELLEIADDGTNDWMQKNLNGGEVIEVPNKEHVQRSRLRIDTRKWFLSKVLPKLYGDKLDLTTKGESFKDTPLTDEQKARLAESLKS